MFFLEYIFMTGKDTFFSLHMQMWCPDDDFVINYSIVLEVCGQYESYKEKALLTKHYKIVFMLTLIECNR